MGDSACPRCKSTKYEKPSLKLLVNVCGHPLCEHCMEMLFVRGVGNCTICNVSLRKNGFRLQQFESAEVERYVEIRGRLSRDYNKVRSDFETLREYNDYLEEVETIVFNLTYGIDVEETKRKVEKYRAENQDQKRCRAKTEDEEEIDRLIEEEENLHMEWVKKKKNAEEYERSQREKRKLELLNDFMFSDLPANEILMNHREVKYREEEKTSKFSSGISIGKHDTATASVKLTDESMSLEELQYIPFNRQTEEEGPDDPDEEGLKILGYLSKVRSLDVREDGGGLRQVTLCSRAIGDAYNGLFIFADVRV